MKKTKWQIKFNLTRNNDYKDDDETMFDKSHIEDEIITWLEDLDYEVKNVKIIKNN